jgi:hypothetical protein
MGEAGEILEYREVECVIREAVELVHGCQRLMLGSAGEGNLVVVPGTTQYEMFPFRVGEYTQKA